MTEEQELGDWLAEHLMGWPVCRQGGCYCGLLPTRHATKHGGHNGNWLTTTGDGMLAVLEAIQKQPDKVKARFVESLYHQVRAALGLTAALDLLPLYVSPFAVAHAAKAALEAKLEIPT